MDKAPPTLDQHWPPPPPRSMRDNPPPAEGLPPGRRRAADRLQNLAAAAAALCPGLDADDQPVPLPEDTALTGSSAFVLAAVREWLDRHLPGPAPQSLAELRALPCALVIDYRRWSHVASVLPGDIVICADWAGVAAAPQCMGCRDVLVSGVTPSSYPLPVHGAWAQTVWTSSITEIIRLVIETPDTTAARKSK